MACRAARPYGPGPANEDWRQVDSEHFVITFTDSLEPLVERTAASAERAYDLLSDRFVDGPDGRIQLLLTDHADIANGFATPVPFNRITIFASPPVDGGNISYFDDWLELVITHELVHTFHLELTGTIGKVVRAMFGRIPGSWPVFPSASTPTWLVEGLATYYESQLTGAGRVKGTWHEMVLRTAALEGAFPTASQTSGASPVWPHGNRPYVFGSSFLQHQSTRYGEDVIGDFAESAAGQWIPYRLNSAAYDAFGSTVTGDWAQWTAQVAQEVQAQAERLAADAPITRGEPIETAGRLAQQAVVSPDGSTLAFTRSDGVDRTQIRLANLDGTGARPLTRLNGVTTLSWAPDGDLVFPQLDFTDRFRIRTDVYRTTTDGAVSRLTHGARLSYPDISPDGRRIVAAREGGGSNELVMLDVESGDIVPISNGSLDEHWAFPRWSPDGSRIAVVRWQAPGYMDIVVMRPDGAGLVEITKDRAVDTNPTWTPDGARVMWSSDRSGIPNLYLASADGRADNGGAAGSGPGALRQVTNMLGGATHPSVDPSASWIYFSSYHADGWHIERIPFEEGAWFDPQPMDDRFEPQPPLRSTRAVQASQLGEVRDYGAGSTLRPYYWSPLLRPPERAFDQSGVQRDVVKAAVGIQIQGADLVGRHAFALSGQLSVDGDRFIGGMAYNYRGLGNPVIGLALSQDYDASPNSFNVQFPDSSVSEFFLLEREQRALLSASFLRRRFRSFSALTFSGGLIREYLTLQGLDRTDGPTLTRPRPERTFVEGRVTLSASNTQARPFSYSAEDGVFGFVSTRVRREADLDSSLRGILGEDRSFQEVIGEVQAFKAIGGPGFANHVLAFRLSGGAGFGPGANAFHYEIGGAEGVTEGVTGLGLFGGVPSLFPIRGYPEDNFRFGRYAWTGSAEYRFPIAMVDQGLGSLPLFFDRVHGSVFFDAGNAWGPQLGVAGFDNPRRETLASIGAEISTIFLPLYAGRLTARFGMGYPLQVLTDPRFYIRIGNSF